MEYLSLYDVYKFHKPDQDTSFAGPFHPLAFAAVDHKDARAKIVFAYEWRATRHVVKDFPRRYLPFTHCYVALFPGDDAPPICISFDPQCLVNMVENGRVCRRFPELQEQAASHFGALEKLSKLKAFLHPNARHSVPGFVSDQSFYVGDSFASVDLHKDAHVRGALSVIDQWRENPPGYAFLSVGGQNCHDLCREVLKGSGVSKPFWWGHFGAPFLDAWLIEVKCRGALKRAADWLFQPLSVTPHVIAKVPQKDVELWKAAHRRIGLEEWSPS